MPFVPYVIEREVLGTILVGNTWRPSLGGLIVQS